MKENKKNKKEKVYNPWKRVRPPNMLGDGCPSEGHIYPTTLLKYPERILGQEDSVKVNTENTANLLERVNHALLTPSYTKPAPEGLPQDALPWIEYLCNKTWLIATFLWVLLLFLKVRMIITLLLLKFTLILILLLVIVCVLLLLLLLLVGAITILLKNARVSLNL